MKKMKAEEIIDLLDLSPLDQEGGFFRRIWTSSIPAETPSGGRAASYAASSAIYYLITSESYSHLHSLKSDELWHFYQGDSVELYLFPAQGSLYPQKVTLGTNLQEGERPFCSAPAGTVFGARLKEGEWALLGNTVTPSFEVEDFETVSCNEALKRWPDYAEWIENLCGEGP